MTNCTNDTVLPLITDPCGGDRTLTGCIFSNKGFTSLNVPPNSSLEVILDASISSLDYATGRINEQGLAIEDLETAVANLEAPTAGESFWSRAAETIKNNNIGNVIVKLFNTKVLNIVNESEVAVVEIQNNGDIYNADTHSSNFQFKTVGGALKFNTNAFTSVADKWTSNVPIKYLSTTPTDTDPLRLVSRGEVLGLIPLVSSNSLSFTNGNGVTGVVTPDIGGQDLSISLQNITPTSVAATGNITGQNLTGTNTGDETNATIKSKLAITTLSGSNTGDESGATILSKLAISSISGNNTGDESNATIKSKLGITTLSGVNTGDENNSTILSKLGISSISGTNTGDDNSSTILSKLGIASISGVNTGDETNASILSKLAISSISGTNTGDDATNASSNSYSDSKVVNSLVFNDNNHAPSSQTVYDALTDKAGLSSGNTFAGTQLINGKTTVSYNNITDNDAALVVTKSGGGADTVSKKLITLFKNTGDTANVFDTTNEVIVGLQAGTTANHRKYFAFIDYQGVTQWLMGDNAQGVNILYDGQGAGGHRAWLEPTATSGHSYYNSLGAGIVQFGMLNDGSNNIGTGGIVVGSGGNTPIQAHRLYGDGKFNFGQLVTNNANYQGTLGNTAEGITSTSQGGLLGLVTASPTANAANLVWGVNYTAKTASAFTQNSIGGGTFVSQNNGTGVVARLRGVNGRVENLNTTNTTLGSAVTAEVNVATGSNIATYIAFDSTAPTGSGTITTAYQFRARDFGTTGFLGEISSGSGKRNMSLTGTAPSHVSSRLLLGSNLDDGVNALQVTGSAIFTGVVTGVSPTLSGHLATKSYVDTFAAAELKDFYIDVVNSSTTETDLYSYITAVNRLNAIGEKITCTFSGSFNDITATTSLKIYFGGILIGDTGILTNSFIGDWTAKATIIKNTSTTARATVEIITPTASIANHNTVSTLSGLTFSNTNILKITGTASGATGGGGDITAKMGNIKWHPAA